MTAIVSVNLRPYNEIHLIADTRISYEVNNRTEYIKEYGLQKIIPLISTDKKSIGAIGFSGYLEPLQIIMHHLIKNKEIDNYKSSFKIEDIAENLRGFIQEGLNKVPDNPYKYQFMIMFAAIDTSRRSLAKDEMGNLSFLPIYLSSIYFFKADKNKTVRVTKSDKIFEIIGEGEKIKPQLLPNVNTIFGFGKPYDGMPHFRSGISTSIIADIFQEQKITSVGGPYWTWQILDPNRESIQYWTWDARSPKIEVEHKNNNFIITNKTTREKRTILHILNIQNLNTRNRNASI